MSAGEVTEGKAACRWEFGVGGDGSPATGWPRRGPIHAGAQGLKSRAVQGPAFGLRSRSRRLLTKSYISYTF